VVKLADFGLAAKVAERNSLKTQCGTPAYVAPEILEGVNYGARVDLWSMGVVAFVLLGGYPPFYEESRDELYARIRNGEYEFHEEYWGRISDEAKTFVAKLLVVDPRLRYSASSALHVDRWMREEDEKLHVRTIRKSNRATKSNLYRQPSLGHHASTTSLYSMTSMAYE
jgi:calcium/calmodulin-dependent protein kinase I